MDALIPTLTIDVVKYFFEKAFEPLKELASYQIDKVNINEICKEAYNSLSNLDQVRTALLHKAVLKVCFSNIISE